MLELITSKIWEILKSREISLAMVFDKEGRILWHKGRSIQGSTIKNGQGFSKSFIEKCVLSNESIDKENVIVKNAADLASKSAIRLVLKCLIIHPLGNDLYLYLDSGKKESFDSCQREMFRLLGDMLAGLIRQLKSHQTTAGDMIGTSDAIQNVKKLILNFAIVSEPILLKGETGVGKNFAAEQIHRYSGRSGKLVVVHTPSINEQLFESEIFGHRKGAFTDAKFDQKGLVAEAHQGTIFFDEISEIPLSFQAKLLRFIETKKYRILGESSEREADVRIITATNKDLFKAIDAGEFREDLYYRLHILEIEIPPLRKRKQDIRALVQQKQALLRGKTPGDGFWDTVLDYHWPGNVRELITVLKRAGIISADPVTGEEIEAAIGLGKQKKSIDTSNIDIEVIWKEIEAGRSFWEVLWSLFISRDVDRKFTKKVLKKAYELSDTNFKKMITLLNIHPSEYQNFMSLMYKYKLDPREIE